MNELEKKLLAEESGGVEPQMCIRSRTRIDTGRWWWPTPVWLCVVGAELYILAVSRRRYVARIPVSACSGSYYCHPTGELVIEPAEELLHKRFKIRPLQALEILKAMGLPQWEPGLFEAAPAYSEETKQSAQAGAAGVTEAGESAEAEQPSPDVVLN